MENIKGWDVTLEELEKSKEMKPLLPISKLVPNDEKSYEDVVIKENEPRIIEYNDSEGKPQSFKVIGVYAVVGNSYIEADMPVGAKTLQLSLLRYAPLKGKILRISATTAMFKQGENRAYRVTEIKGERAEQIKALSLDI